MQWDHIEVDFIMDDLMKTTVVYIILIWNTTVKLESLDGGVNEEILTFIYGIHIQKELERLMVINGFIIEKLFSNWNEEPLSETSSEMICICKKM